MTIKTADKPASSRSSHREPRADNPRHDATGTANDTVLDAETAGVIASSPQKRSSGTKNNLFAMARASVSADAVAKMQVVGEIRQRLAEAAERFEQSGAESSEATDIASGAALKLYQARVAGQLQAEEVTAMLGDIFGFKRTPRGEVSKTPAGQGEQIRKRVQRAVKAWEYTQGKEPDRFFESLDTDDVQSVIDDIESGTYSIWTGFDQLSELKKGGTVRVHQAFNPAAIARMVSKLSEKGAVDQFVTNPALFRAYGALADVLDVIGTTLAARDDANDILDVVTGEND